MWHYWYWLINLLNAMARGFRYSVNFWFNAFLFMWKITRKICYTFLIRCGTQCDLISWKFVRILINRLSMRTILLKLFITSATNISKNILFRSMWWKMVSYLVWYLNIVRYLLLIIVLWSNAHFIKLSQPYQKLIYFEMTRVLRCYEFYSSELLHLDDKWMKSTWMNFMQKDVNSEYTKKNINFNKIVICSYFVLLSSGFTTRT